LVNGISITPFDYPSSAVNPRYFFAIFYSIHRKTRYFPASDSPCVDQISQGIYDLCDRRSAAINIQQGRKNLVGGECLIPANRQISHDRDSDVGAPVVKSLAANEHAWRRSQSRLGRCRQPGDL
jgi:hypothetical protein